MSTESKLTHPKPWAGPIVHLHWQSEHSIESSVKTLDLDGNSRGTTVFASLHPDLIVHIAKLLLDHATDPSGSFGDACPDPTNVIRCLYWETQSWIYSLILINKHWHGAALPLLYRRLVVASPWSLIKLTKKLGAVPVMSTWVKEIVLLDHTHEGDVYSFYRVARGPGTESLRKETEDAFVGLLADRDPGTLDIRFITKYSPFFDPNDSRSFPFVQETSRRMPKSSFSFDADAWTARTALSSLRSLTLHGFASHFLYVPLATWSDATHVAFGGLKHLTLDSFSLQNMNWPFMPSLDTLIMVNCYSESDPFPTPELAPILHRVTVISYGKGYFGWTHNYSTKLIRSLLSHGQNLFYLELDFPNYARINTSIGISEAFPVLRQLVIHKLTESQHPFNRQEKYHDAWTEGIILPERLPSDLSILRITGSLERLSVLEGFVAFKPRHAPKILASDLIEHRRGKWKGLHIFGQESFWKAVPERYAVSDAETACARAKIECQSDLGDPDPERKYLWHFKPLYNELAKRSEASGMVVWRRH